MDKKLIAWVEVHYLFGDFVSVDFGDFAITIFKEVGKPRIVLSKGNNYEGGYWGFLDSLSGLPVTMESREICPMDFKKFKYIALRLYRPTQKQFREFIAKVFPDYANALAD